MPPAPHRRLAAIAAGATRPAESAESPVPAGPTDGGVGLDGHVAERDRPARDVRAAAVRRPAIAAGGGMARRSALAASPPAPPEAPGRRRRRSAMPG